MIDYIQDMGPIGLLDIIILVYIVIIGLKNAYLLFIRKPPETLPKGHIRSH